MKKSIINTIMGLVLTGTTILCLSSCTWLSGIGDKDFTTPAEGGAVYHGKIQTGREDGDAHYLMGCILQERKKHHLAIEEFNWAVESDPGNVAAYNQLGVSLDATGDYDGAVSAYTAALKVDPNLDYVFNNLGYSYLLQGRPDLAIGYFEKAVALDGINQRYRNNLGLAYARSGKYEAALTAFKSGGDDAEAHFKMGQFYFRNGFYEEADVHFTWASILKPSDADIGKARKASASLAQIHESSSRIEPEIKAAFPDQETKKPIALYDDDGFYTIPAGAIEDIKVIEVKPINPVKGAFATSTGVKDQASYTATMASEVRLEEDSLKPFDVLKRMERLNLESAETVKVSFTGSKVEISNGNGVNGMARTVGNFLKSKGVTDYRLTNADHFGYAESVIYYRDGFFDQASRIKGLLPGLSNTDQLVASHLKREPIRVLIGRDLVMPFNDHLKYDFNVDLSNGNGVNGMARRLGKHLNIKGFRVGRLTNADHFGYKRTIVFYSKGQSNQARLVADALPGDFKSRIVEVRNSDNLVQVVLGSDMVI